MSWEKTKIGDHCEITSSKRIFYSEYTDSGVPFYRSKEIIESSQGQPISEPLYISTDKYNDIKSKFGVPLPGDMLLTSVGTIGIPYIVRTDDYFYFKDGNLTWFRNFDDSLSSEFLCYWIGSKDGYGVLNNTTIGSSQKALTISSLKQIECPLPPIEVQNRIVDILSAYDALIENNQKQIKLLEEAARRLYKEWFVNFRFPGYEDTPIVDGVPEGWEEAPIDSRISLLSGYAFKSAQFDSSGEYKIVTIKNVKDGEFDGINTNRIVSIPGKTPKHCVLTDGDILLSLTGNVGRTCIVNGNNYLLNQRVAKLQSDIPAFTYCLFRSSDMFDAMNNLANGTAQQNLSPIRTGKISILFPADNLLEEFERIVGSMISKMLSLIKQCDLLIQARDRLLPKLISGEIEV